MLEIINAIEIDVALVSGLMALLLACVVTVIGFIKMAGQSNYQIRLGSSEADKLVNIGNLITLVALFPLTIYVVTRAFPTLFQQFIICFIVLGVFTTVEKSRYIIQIPVSYAMLVVIAIIEIPLKAVYGLFLRLRGST